MYLHFLYVHSAGFLVAHLRAIALLELDGSVFVCMRQRQRAREAEAVREMARVSTANANKHYKKCTLQCASSAIYKYYTIQYDARITITWMPTSQPAYIAMMILSLLPMAACSNMEIKAHTGVAAHHTRNKIVAITWKPNGRPLLDGRRHE